MEQVKNTKYVKLHPRTGHKGPEGELRYIPTLFFNLSTKHE